MFVQLLADDNENEIPVAMVSIYSINVNHKANCKIIFFVKFSLTFRIFHHLQNVNWAKVGPGWNFVSLLRVYSYFIPT